MGTLEHLNLHALRHGAKTLGLLLVIGGVSAGALSADPVTLQNVVTMQLENSPGQPNIYNFLVNGTTTLQLFCDDPSHGIVTTPYQATVTTLSGNLGNTLLGSSGDPQALLHYQQIAIIEQNILAGTDSLRDGMLAIWSISTGRPRTGDAAADALVSWVATQNPANYDLRNFTIFSAPNTQEQTGSGVVSGVTSVPEPSFWTPLSLALFLLIFLRSRHSARKRELLQQCARTGTDGTLS